MTRPDAPKHSAMIFGLRNDALACPVCSDYLCSCHGPDDDAAPAVGPPDDYRTWMTAWCEAAAANA